MISLFGGIWNSGVQVRKAVECFKLCVLWYGYKPMDISEWNVMDGKKMVPIVKSGTMQSCSFKLCLMGHSSRSIGISGTKGDLMRCGYMEQEVSRRRILVCC